MIDVVAAVMESNGRYLIARRAAHKVQGGKWEFPGGKVEENETFEGALVREFMEEFGVKLSVGDVLLSTQHQYPDFEINLIAMDAKTEDEILESTDHDLIEWVELRKLSAYVLCDADLSIVKHLQRDGFAH